MGLVIAAADLATGAAAGADTLEQPIAVAPSDPSAEKKVDGARPNSASDPVNADYRFLLEVAGVTPSGDAITDPKRRTGARSDRDPRAGMPVDPAD